MLGAYMYNCTDTCTIDVVTLAMFNPITVKDSDSVVDNTAVGVMPIAGVMLFKNVVVISYPNVSAVKIPISVAVL